MTFWYVFWNGLNFFELFKFYSSFGIDHDPHVFYDHMTYVYFLSLCFFLSSHDVMAKRSHSSYYDLFDFGVLLIYGRTLTLTIFFLHNDTTTPILAIEVLVIRTHLKKDPTRTRRVAIRKIPTVRRRTVFGPD